MPNWLIWVLAGVVVLPGVLVVLAGVLAMFMMPQNADGARPGDGPPQPDAEGEPERAA